MCDEFEICFMSKFLPVPWWYFNILEKELVHFTEQNTYDDYVVPRLVAVYSDIRSNYMHSGRSLPPLPWHSPSDRFPLSDTANTLAEIRDLVENETNEEFDMCLVHQYQDGNESIGKHKESEDLDFPIACVSLGEPRTIIFSKPGCGKVKYRLNSGSLYTMYPPTNCSWFREIPKEPGQTGKHMSLTFKMID